MALINHVSRLQDHGKRNYVFRMALYCLWAEKGELFAKKGKSWDPIKAMMAMWIDLLHTNYQVVRFELWNRNFRGKLLPPCDCALCFMPLLKYDPTYFWKMWSELGLNSPTCNCPICSTQPVAATQGSPIINSYCYQDESFGRNVGPSTSRAGPSARAAENINGSRSYQQPPPSGYLRYVVQPVTEVRQKDEGYWVHESRPAVKRKF